MAEPTAKDVVERAVLDTLKREKVPLKTSEIAQWSDLSYDAARRACLRLRGQGLVFNNDAGYWTLVENQSAQNPTSGDLGPLFVCPRKGCNLAGTVVVCRGNWALFMCQADAELLVGDDWQGWVVNMERPPTSGGWPTLEVYRVKDAG